MKIGEMAKLLNTSVQTLRFYEISGLIESKRTDGGTRHYDKDDVNRIKVIQILTELGIPHKQLKKLADTRLMCKTGDESSHAVASQLSDISTTLTKLRSLINNTIKDVKNADDFVQQCFGCKKTPRRSICNECDVTKNINNSKMISLVWDQ